ncbi:hypothetical protein AOLI_G00308880 [Acnodon oligacanthus]
MGDGKHQATLIACLARVVPNQWCVFKTEHWKTIQQACSSQDAADAQGPVTLLDRPDIQKKHPKTRVVKTCQSSLSAASSSAYRLPGDGARRIPANPTTEPPPGRLRHAHLPLRSGARTDESQHCASGRSYTIRSHTQ